MAGVAPLLPKVHVLGTGGTMAHVAADRLNFVRYAEGNAAIDIAETLRRVPEVERVARIEAEQFFLETPRRYLGPDEWPALARR